jgi:autotransporter-associated beta strand protein
VSKKKLASVQIAGALVDQTNSFLSALSSTALSARSHYTIDGTLILRGFSNSVASLAGTGRVANSNATAATLTIAPAEGTKTFSGLIEDGAGGGPLSLVKTGAGTQVLAGSSTYTGATTVSGGTLVVNSSIASSSSLTIAAGANGLPGASFAVTGARPDRNAALVTAGADIRLSQTVSLGMHVDTELSANTGRLGGTAQLRVSF